MYLICYYRYTSTKGRISKQHKNALVKVAQIRQYLFAMLVCVHTHTQVGCFLLLLLLYYIITKKSIPRIFVWVCHFKQTFAAFFDIFDIITSLSRKKRGFVLYVAQFFSALKKKNVLYVAQFICYPNNQSVIHATADYFSLAEKSAHRQAHRA